MGQKLIVGPNITKGLKNNLEPFAIDNDSFPTLINAYQWRGRVKRKRGTGILTRLQRIIGTTDAVTGNFTVIISPHPLQAGISLFTVGTTVFVDWDIDASHNPVTLITNSISSTATLNRSTGQLIITGANLNPLTSVIYFTGLPVMGLEDWSDSSQAFLQNISFDTTYAYNISTAAPYTPTDISFYKNPPSSGTYVAKGTATPLWWNGQNYQQFWSTNYQGAFWATNGIPIPFSSTNIGMQYSPASDIARTATATTTTTIELNIASSPLVVGDFVFFNEWTGANAGDINFKTGYVTAAAAPIYTITFQEAILTAGGTYVPGIVQYLTTRKTATLDCIRWYDGTGWVNFAPPLSQFNFVIDDAPQAIYYLAGARMIIPFKDRLLFFGPVIQTATTNPTKIYLQDTVIFSQNGTPYYTSTFIGTNPLASNIPFNAVLVPTNQTATPTAFFEDQFGFGGWAAANIDQQITTVDINEDALILGFNESTQARMVYTGNDIIPFQFYIINDELGSASTFSSISFDEGVLTRGLRGIVITSQVSCARIDLDIPDQVFQISNLSNGSERFTAGRDFISEWVYYTYPDNESTYIFPNQTLQYNYRDKTFGIFNECYTTYGNFRKRTGETWATIGSVYPTWNDWNVPWNSGESNILEPLVIAGNQQGYVLIRDTSTTGEAPSLYINNISGNVVTSVNHCLPDGDYILIEDALGTVSSQVNGKVFSVKVIDNNTFNLNPSITSATYLGGGTITRMYIPKIYSKQFPVAWELGCKTRLGVQQYLFTKTDTSQVTLLIFLSTNASQAFNDSPIVPDPDCINNGLVYSTVLFTCPESTNLGLTPANTNLQNLTSIDSSGRSSNNQEQIWHRMNTSLIGDTVQFGFTLNDAQMRDPNLFHQFAEIEFHAAVLDLNPSGVLA